MLISVFLVYTVGFARSLDALDGSFRNFILFTKFGNFTGQHYTAVSQFQRCILFRFSVTLTRTLIPTLRFLMRSQPHRGSGLSP
jgi:hypothetical protein